jgi:drug/metabolite transporter, DME family
MTAVSDRYQTSTHVPIGASMMVLGAGIVFSFGAVLAREADHADVWQYLNLRSVSIVIVVEIVSTFRRRPNALARAYRGGRTMLLACLCLLVASLAFVYAIKNTSAANAAFLSSVTPLFAILLARVILGERMTRVTVAATGLALAGLAVTVLGDLGGGGMIGNLAAVTSALGYAGYTVCVRSDVYRDWSPVLPGYAVMLALLCSIVTVAEGKPLLPPFPSSAYPVIHGALIIVIGTLMFNHAARSVPAVPMTVLAQSENVFVPVWIFLVIGERPKVSALIGGAIIFVAIVGKATLDARQARPPLGAYVGGPGPGSIA